MLRCAEGHAVGTARPGEAKSIAEPPQSRELTSPKSQGSRLTEQITEDMWGGDGEAGGGLMCWL